MTDPYTPKLSSFKFSSLERRAVKWALTKPNPWGVDELSKKTLSSKEKAFVQAIAKLKDRIKEFHLKRQNGCCCYCAQNLENRPIEQDREHIVPKGKEKALSFSIFNLAVACKTCNMSVKNTKTSHLRGYRHGGLRDAKVILNPKNYNIPHPNIHDWEEHIEFTLKQTGRGGKVSHYRARTGRGRFAYYFFKLDELEQFANTEEQRKLESAQPLYPKLVELRDKFRQ